MPRVSVIIPTYNCAQYIRAAIDSVFNQDFAAVEVLVIDDGSTDNTRELLTALGDDRVRYLHQVNQGPAAARNTGLQAARGEFITFLDADDTFLSNKLPEQVAVLDQHPECGVVYSDAYLCDSNMRTLCLASEAMGYATRPSGKVLDQMARGIFFLVHAAMFRRACLADSLRFDDSLLARSEDWDFWIRLAARTEFIHHPAVVANYRLHGNMASSDRQKFWRGTLQVRRKLHASPAFDQLQPATRQYSWFQIGKLSCLLGETPDGRAALRQAFGNAPRIPQAGLMWCLSFLGARLLRAVWSLRTRIIYLLRPNSFRRHLKRQTSR